MKKCTHCHEKLSNYKTSVEIPGRKKHHYICCLKCGCVMIAKLDDVGNIQYLEATPMKNDKKTKEMMREARSLFAEAGFRVQRDEMYKAPVAVEPVPDTEHDYNIAEKEEKPVESVGSQSTDTNSEYTKKKELFIIRWIKKLFGKAA